MCAILYVWKSEDDLQELTIFYHVGCRDGTQVFGCGIKHLSLQSPHTGSILRFLESRIVDQHLRG